MKSKLFKIMLKTMVMIVMLFTISLTACSRDGGTESADPSEGTDNSSEDDNDDSSAGDFSTENIDGIEATIGNDDVQYSESKTTSVIKILEKTSTNPNDIYDEADYGISISVSNDSDSYDSEQLAFTMSINEYVDFKVDTIYEYNPDNYEAWSAHLSYCPG